MRRILRTAVCYVFATLISVGGTAMTPDRVLCVGPGSHYHLETVVGASCNEPLPFSESSTPRDGCPKGSKDLRLGVDTHRGKNPFVAGTFAPILTVATGSIGALEILHEGPNLPRSPRAQLSRTTTVILRC
jgi:hypothetical protein